MSECRACIEGSINSNGRCELCGFDEMQFINEWDDWTETLSDEEVYESYTFYCQVEAALDEALAKAA